MTLISRFLVPLALLASILPSVTANSSNCKSSEFWYQNKNCCVPRNPPNNPPSPPSGKSCPSHNWYWSQEQSCCVPTAPPPPSNPAPSCQKGHSWNDKESCCSAPSPSNCDDEEFWYTPKNCCLPHGGPSNPPSPPPGSECPPSGWYWGDDQKCCVPHHPNPPSPQCPSGWEWSSASNKCQPKSTPPSPKTPQPSNHYSGHDWKKRAQKHRANSLCPNEMTACPVVGTYGAFSDYECIDTKYDLQSCGGCSSTGAGQDCTAIRGAWNVGCNAGKCTVYNCMAGYRLAGNGVCIPL